MAGLLHDLKDVVPHGPARDPIRSRPVTDTLHRFLPAGAAPLGEDDCPLVLLPASQEVDEMLDSIGQTHMIGVIIVIKVVSGGKVMVLEHLSVGVRDTANPQEEPPGLKLAHPKFDVPRPVEKRVACLTTLPGLPVDVVVVVRIRLGRRFRHGDMSLDRAQGDMSHDSRILMIHDERHHHTTSGIPGEGKAGKQSKGKAAGQGCVCNETTIQQVEGRDLQRA